MDMVENYFTVGTWLNELDPSIYRPVLLQAKPVDPILAKAAGRNCLVYLGDLGKTCFYLPKPVIVPLLLLFKKQICTNQLYWLHNPFINVLFNLILIMAMH
jgi:hypothetical protein